MLDKISNQDVSALTHSFLTGEELSQEELLSLLQMAESGRERRGRAGVAPALDGKTIALVFEKPSLRTRVSFTVAIQELGGQVIEIASANRKDETPEDTIRVLAGYCHGVMLRTHAHETLERMAKVTDIPLINGLSNEHHPCQVLADLQTLAQTFGGIESLGGLKLTYIGDGNNMLHSLLLLAPFVGIELRYSCPQGFGPDANILKRAHLRARMGGGRILAFADPRDAVRETDALYTDVWTSMGFDLKTKQETRQREEAFASYQVNEDLYRLARPHAAIMHCMPMVRGREITDGMIEHQNAVLFRQSENRLHAQKALLLHMFAHQAEAAQSSSGARAWKPSQRVSS